MNDEILTRDLKKIKQYFIDLEDHAAFPVWVMAQLHFGGDLSESNLEESYDKTLSILGDDGPGDKGLDGYFYENDSNTLFLYQFKWKESIKTKSTRKDLMEITNALAILYNNRESSNNSPIRKEIMSCLDEVCSAKGNIVLRAVTSGYWPKGAVQKMREGCPSIDGVTISCEALDKDTLHQEILERTQDLKGEQYTFDLYEDEAPQFMRFGKNLVSGVNRSFITNLSGRSLQSVSIKTGNKLFDMNVRQSLGRNSINKGILQTLSDCNGRKEFWFGHNGITILCDKVDESGLDSEHPFLKLTNPQVVNGCQTLTTLRDIKFDSEDHHDFAVLARVIELGFDQELNKETALLIASRTNSQSKVSGADLRANDVEQVRLQKLLAELTPPWFYERKRGEWKALPKGKQARFTEKNNSDRRIDRENYQQAWRSYLGRPSHAIVHKGVIWEDNHSIRNGLYKEVFGNQRRPEDVILVSCIYDWFNQVLKADRKGNSLALEIHHGLRENMIRISQAKALTVAHAVGLFGVAMDEVFGDKCNVPKEYILAITGSLKRGTSVGRYWTTSDDEASWRPIKRITENILFTISLFVETQLPNPESSLRDHLKQSHEQSFEQLKRSFVAMKKHNFKAEVLANAEINDS